jgi:DNA-binding winged helix-turn-helix (wHTH) protein/tetratricopeptide (TPR) repeat protein
LRRPAESFILRILPLAAVSIGGSAQDRGMANDSAAGDSGPDVGPLRLRFDAFELDEADARLTRDGRPIAVAPKAFAVLCELARKPGSLISKNGLLDAVWGHQFVSESVLKTTVSELRAALADDAKQPRYIETVSRRGYRFIGAVASSPRAAASVAVPAAALPFERAAPSVDAEAIVGRQAQLARLRSAWSRAVSGERQVFWIAGEAGVGKTTLIDHFVAGLGPVACARGQCVEQYGAGEPYLPVLEALGELSRNDPALAPLLRSVAPTWLLQLPWLSSEAEREALQRELSGVSQDRMLRELGELLDRYTREQPFLLVTEDLHWSDHATLHLINHIARRRSPARLMWLASFRLAEIIAEDHPLKALRHELRLHRLCQEIVLDPFSEQEIADYIAGRVPDAVVAEPFVRALHARTDGLPLFVTHVVDDLVAQGALGSTDPAADLRFASTAIPENLAGIIGRQIGRLAPEQRAVLEVASVCGVEFRPATVADVLEGDAGSVAAQCDELVRQQQWLGGATIGRLADGSLDARYAFRHALYRHVFYDRLGALTRAQWHRRVGASLERSRTAGVAVTAAELASHFELGHEPLAALRHYVDATQSALRHFAPAEAVNLTAHALELLPRAPAGTARDALELGLAAMRGASAAQLFGVSSLEAKQGFERALALLDVLPQHPLRALVLHGLGLVLMVRGEYAQAQRLAERTHALAAATGEGALMLSACSVLGQIHTLQGRPRQACDWLARGVAACEQIGDAALKAAFVVDPAVTMYATLSIPLLHAGLADQARARLQVAQQRARRLGEPMARLVAAWFGALLARRLDDVESMAALAEAMGDVAEDAALAQGRAAHRAFRGWAQARRGAPQEGFREIRAAYEDNAALGMFSGGSEVLGYAAEALVLAGDLAGAQAQLAQAFELAERLPEGVYLPQLWLLQARIAEARAQPSLAREAMEQALREAREQRAVWLELVVLVAACERGQAAAADFEGLAAVVAQLDEGLDTAPVIRARQLLEGHRRVLPPAS